MRLNVNRFKYKIMLAMIVISLNATLTYAQRQTLDFYANTFEFDADSALQINIANQPTEAEAHFFFKRVVAHPPQTLLNKLEKFRKAHELNDWIFYQLVRKVAEKISPKNENYFKYTLTKWFLMCKSGFDARLAIGNDQIIFFIRSDEDISDIPYFMVDGKKFICLNYHDYGKLFNRETAYKLLQLPIGGGKNNFSYKITQLPDFKPESYQEREVQFNINQSAYHFKLKINKDISGIFKNYPIVNFETYFNIPLSKETYSSLIPVLKAQIKDLDQQKGVDYLMRFTRYAFLYENDEQQFGVEKRLSPEQTLINQYSDCDDRAALFFYLVKEIYNLPMIALLYPNHLTMAVQFDKPIGQFIIYNGKKYSFCEPTPQIEDLKIGQIAQSLKNLSFEVVYAYEPKR